MVSQTKDSVHDLELQNIMASFVSRVNQLSQKSAGPLGQNQSECHLKDSGLSRMFLDIIF